MSRNSPMGIPCRFHFHIVKRHRRDYLKTGDDQKDSILSIALHSNKISRNQNSFLSTKIVESCKGG